MLPLFIIIFSLLLDGIITNYLPYLINDLSLFTPLLTVVSLFIIYPFYRKKESKYFATAFIIGIAYDLLYTNLLFFNAVLFLIIALISYSIYKNFELSFIRLIFYVIAIVVSYEVITALIILLFNLTPVTVEKLIYKITHSLILNIIYAEIIYILLKLIPKKYLKISIN